MDDDQSRSQSPATLGAAVRQARARLGLSLRDLAALTAIPRSSLHRLELDQMDHPSPTLLQTLAETLELPSDDLFAFVGYHLSDQLPSLAPYLRTKYQLPPEAVAEADAALRDILDRYERTRRRE